MPTLYYLSGSGHSEKAKELLKNRFVSFRTIDASSRSVLAAIFRDLSIRQLPTLIYEHDKYEGLDKIANFVKTYEKAANGSVRSPSKRHGAYRNGRKKK